MILSSMAAILAGHEIAGRLGTQHVQGSIVIGVLFLLVLIPSYCKKLTLHYSSFHTRFDTNCLGQES